MAPEISASDNGTLNRPRRPDDSTLSYLKSLPFDLKFAQNEIKAFLNQVPPTKNGNTVEMNASSDNDVTVEFPQSFAAALSALDEIQHEVASVSGDEYGAQTIETMARIVAPHSTLALQLFLQSVSTYSLFLSTHRYGSHVLQTLFELCNNSVNDDMESNKQQRTDLALHADAPVVNKGESLPSLTDLLLSIANELVPHASDLAVHVCGSHVLRSLVCVLCGVEIVAQQHGGGDNMNRRGPTKSKNKKRKKSSYTTDTSESNGRNKSQHHNSQVIAYTINPRFSLYDERLSSVLTQLTLNLSGDTVQPPGVLQDMLCNSSSSFLYSLLLKALTYQASRDTWFKKMQRMQKDVHPSDRYLLKLPMEPSFSTNSSAYELATRFLCWKTSNIDGVPGSAAIDQDWARETIYGLAGDPFGSHVLETILRLAPDDFYVQILQVGRFFEKKALKEYAEHDVGNYIVQTVFATVRSDEQASRLFEAIRALVSSGYLLSSSAKRRGILWRLVEMTTKYTSCQKELIDCLREGLAVVHENKSTKLNDLVALLLDIKRPTCDGDRLSLDASGARVVYHLLRLTPRLCTEVLKGVTGLSQDDLVLLSKDGLGSKCVWDGVLDGPTDDVVFRKAVRRLFVQLQGIWVSLSVDRVGHHCVRKMFRALHSFDDKAELVQELLQGQNQLSGCAMGRSVYQNCFLHEFKVNDRSDWQRIVQKAVEKEDFLDDIVSQFAATSDKKRMDENDNTSKTKKSKSKE